MAESQEALARFMSITGAESTQALQFLELTNWSLDEAVNLYMESGANGGAIASAPPPAPAAAAAGSGGMYDAGDVRAPDPSKRQRLVGDDLLQYPARRMHTQDRDFAAESIAAIHAIAQQNAASASSDSIDADSRARDLHSLFQPPMEILFQGSYSEARQKARAENKWLLINIQDDIVFASHMLNRDTWSNETVQNIVASGFVFSQHYWASDQGKKFCSLYRIEQETLPIIAIIDCRSGEIVAKWTGFIEPHDLAEKLSDFCFAREISDDATSDQTMQSNMVDLSEEDQLAAAIAASLEGQEADASAAAPPPVSGGCIDVDVSEETKMPQQHGAGIELPAEPAAGEPNTTRLQLRGPDGTRLVRRFSKSDPVAYLWAYVLEQMDEARTRPFQLRVSFPPQVLEYSESDTIAERQLENASLIVQWT